MDLDVQAFRIAQEATTDAESQRAKRASLQKGGIKGGSTRARSINENNRTHFARLAGKAH